MDRHTDITKPAAPTNDADAIYLQLKALVRAVIRGHRHPGLLQTTAIVHETWLRLSKLELMSEKRQCREELAALAGSVIRSVLLDEAKRENRKKRGGGWQRVPIAAADLVNGTTAPTVDIMELDAALRELAELDSRAARIVEMRFFGGMSVEATAVALGVSERTVKSDWQRARAFLRVRLAKHMERGD